MSPLSPLFGVGRFEAGGELQDLPCSYEEVLRDAQTAEDYLASVGVERGRFVAIAGKHAEAPLLYPFQVACSRIRVPFLCIDNTALDAARLHEAIRVLPVQAVVGAGAELAGGLKDLDPPGTALPHHLIWVARPEAEEPLRAWGIAPYAMRFLGPAVALGCANHSLLHLDPGEWGLSEDERDGEVLVTNLRPRALRSIARRTGVRAQLVPGTCTCGHPGPSLKVLPSKDDQ